MKKIVAPIFALSIILLAGCQMSSKPTQADEENQFQSEIQGWVNKGENLSQISTDTGNTPLGDAMFRCLPGGVKTLMDKGVSANFVQRLSGNTLQGEYVPSICHSFKVDGRDAKALEIVELMLSKGADVNAVDVRQDTILHMVAEEGLPSATERVIRAGGQVNAKDQFGGTPLHYAAVNGRADVVEILLKGGADINAQDPHGFTPLYYAEKQSNKTEETKKPGRDYAKTQKILRDHGAQ